MLKRRFANSNKGDFCLKYLDDEIFSGYVCFNKLMCDKPLIVNDGVKNVCIKDNDFVWILVYPNKANYAITIIFNDKMNLVEWYFNISKNIGIENGIPYEDDLFLDMVITPKGEILILDEDELLKAKEEKIITDEDEKLAYSTLELVKNKYGKEIENLKILTKYLCKQFNLEIF